MAGALAGRRIAVTGSSEGIGRAIACCLASEGARVLVNASGQGSGGVTQAQARLEELVSELETRGGEGAACVASVADQSGATSIIDAAISAFGGLDGLVNCAGIPGKPANSIRDIEIDDWHRVMAVHVDGTFFCSRAAIPHLIAAGGGSIVNTSSAGHLGGYGGSAYPAAKGAINSLTYAMATDLRNEGIRCNAVCPGAKTRLSSGPDYESVIHSLESRGLMDPALVEMSLNAPPAEECAPTYAYLLADVSAKITGRLFTAAGGYVGLAPLGADKLIGMRDAAQGGWSVESLAAAMTEAGEGA